VARAIEQPVQGAAVRHAGVGAVAQFVVAVQETALQLVAGRAKVWRVWVSLSNWPTGS
jgi:hypothetical protein